jgi:hypothetical protein
MTTLANYIAPKAYTFTVANGASHTITFPGVAVSLMIENLSAVELFMTFNNDTEAEWYLTANESRGFDPNFAHFTSITFTNFVSGAGACSVQVIAGVVS